MKRTGSTGPSRQHLPHLRAASDTWQKRIRLINIGKRNKQVVRYNRIMMGSDILMFRSSNKGSRPPWAHQKPVTGVTHPRLPGAPQRFFSWEMWHTSLIYGIASTCSHCTMGGPIWIRTRHMSKSADIMTCSCRGCIRHRWAGTWIDCGVHYFVWSIRRVHIH